MSTCADHTYGPTGYLARLEWLDRMSKTHVQRQCHECGLWMIWTPKPKRST